MGLFDRFKKTTGTTTYSTADFYGAWQLTYAERERIMGMDASQMWATQPYLRTVVTFLARNIAQLGLHVYERVEYDDRRRVFDGAAIPLDHPNSGTTTYELVYGLVADLALYDAAYWLLSEDTERPIVRLPVEWVTPRGGDALGPERYEVKMNDRGEVAIIPAKDVLAFHGWSPTNLVGGSSPVKALREILAEQVQAARYRETVWRRGGKVGAALTRPADAPKWGDEARAQFKRDWDAQFTGDGPGVGGTPMLEDGMALTRVDFNAHEMEFIEGSRLALNTVASVYHINPTMIGLLDNANYSNVREFRRMLYGDTLGPILAQIEGRLDAFLVPLYDKRPGIYVEFNIEEKLQGSFEEQTTALQSSIGRPWMTANEGRAMRNMPALDGGDELVTPLNVLVGGQASPTDTVSTLPSAAGFTANTKAGNLFLLKARLSDAHVAKVSEVLTTFFKRQGSAVLPKIGSAKWWDADRWNKELATDLHAVALSVTKSLGRAEAAAMGFEAGDYNEDLTVAFLSAFAQRQAATINATTKDQLDEQVARKEEGNPAHVYEKATTTRAQGAAQGIGTFLAGFATHEAATQVANAYDVEPTKTWVTGGNPRSTHSAMNGQTVALNEDFSNGMPWPGAGSNANEVAGCNCTLRINT